MKNIAKTILLFSMITLLFSCNDALFIENISKKPSSGEVSLNNQFTFNNQTYNVTSAFKSNLVDANCRGTIGSFLIFGETKNGLSPIISVFNVSNYNFKATPGYLSATSCGMEVQIAMRDANNKVQAYYYSVGEGTVELTANTYRLTNVKLRFNNESVANFSVSGGGNYQ
jgi:hypothetical protein